MKSRPKGVPENWVKEKTNRKKSNIGIKYRNPDDHRDNARVMEGNLNHPYANSRSVYIKRTMDGKFYDKYGNRVDDRTNEAHIPYDEFTFISKEKLND